MQISQLSFPLSKKKNLISLLCKESNTDFIGVNLALDMFYLNFIFVCIVSVESSRRQRVTIIRCLSCGQTKKFPNNPKHQLWVDQPEAQLENQLQPGTTCNPVFHLLPPFC